MGRPSDDGWTHVVDVSPHLAPDTRGLELGEGVTVTATPKDNGLTATYLMRDRSDPARKGQTSSKRFQKQHGTVQSISGSTLTFRSDEGRLIPVDVSQIKGTVPKAVGVNDQITLVCEPGARGKLTALWIEPEAVQPSAAVRSTARSERVHGSVDSIDGVKFWLRTDDDRWFLVDTARLDVAARRSLQPGRMLTVVGKISNLDSNELAAESIRLD